jgi:hypothetical protein
MRQVDVLAVVRHTLVAASRLWVNEIRHPLAAVVEIALVARRGWRCYVYRITLSWPFTYPR